jgi:hypothetical protein
MVAIGFALLGFVQTWYAKRQQSQPMAMAA